MKNMFTTTNLKKRMSVALAVFLSVFATQTLFAQADNCSNATPIVCGAALTGQTNVGATNDAFPTCNTNGTLATGAPNVWYSFTGNGNSVTVSTCTNTSFDSEIGIFSGTCGALTCVAGSDGDACGTADETISFVANLGTNYFIMVQGHAGGTGTFTLDVTCTPITDPCLAITTITGCDVSQSITLTGSGAPWNVTSCGFTTAGAEKVYSFTPTITGIHQIEVTAATGFVDYFFKAASGGCSSTGWTCIDDISIPLTVNFGPLTAGTTYLILLDDENTTVSPHTFNINCPVAAPANDACANPTPIACGGTASGNTSAATLDGPATDCGGGSVAPDVWYTFVGTGGSVTASLCAGTTYDSKLDVYTGTCGALVNIGGCSDDFCGAQSQMTWATTAGVVYRIRVHGFNGATGAFSLAVTCVAPANDLCANATPISCGTTVSGSTAAANSDGPATSCNGLSVGPDVWYTFAGNGGTITASLCGSSYDTKIEIYTGACGALTCVTNNDDFCSTQSQVTWASTVGVTYRIRVHGFNGATGLFTLAITCITPLPPNGAATVACPALAVAPSPPVNVPPIVPGCPPVQPVGPTITNVPNPLVCEGTRTYSYTYTDCQGNSIGTWSFVYTIERNPFTVPANGANTVACPSLIVQPTPPVVLSNCGEAITPTGPVIVNNPNPIACEGTRTYTWTYTDCEGNSLPWSHVVTVERLPFSIATPNGGATVDCPDDTDVVPTAPAALSNCGETLAGVLFNVTPKPGCEGQRVYTFRYTDCEGNTADWQYIYNVEYLDFVTPVSIVGNVNCPIEAFEPTPPVIFDNCGKLLTPAGPVITTTPNAQGCEGRRVYAWTYSDCEGNTKVWSQTFNFLYNADFFAPVDEENNVACLAYAVPPFPQPLYDFCGQLIKVSGPSVTQDISANGCAGWRKYSFVYTDCGGHSHPWNYTYYINDDQGPLGVCPSGSTGGTGGPISVNVTNVSCIEDLPCPTTFDFEPKVEELLDAGNYFDACDGANITVTLDSWTDTWQCSDPDGDGVFTFGRTYYFRIADHCGNEYPSLCEVTYSGACQPLVTFPQAAWGVSGGAPGTSVSAATTDLQVIGTLLNNNPLTVGGGNRSIKLTDAQCVVDLLPGMGLPAVLGNCFQDNCVNSCNPMGVGGMKNALAANAIALTLNMRYNVQYNGLTMAGVRSQGLGCLDVHPCILACNANGSDCKLRVFDDQGVEYQYPYNVGGLLDLVNYYLGGNLSLSTGQSVLYSTALNQTIMGVNTNWNEGQVATSCDPNANAVPLEESAKAIVPTGKPSTGSVAAFSLAPNPAGSEVNFKLEEMPEAQELVFEIYNALGQQVLRRDFGKVSSVNERIDLTGINNGLYIVSVKAGGQRFEQKLVVGRN